MCGCARHLSAAIYGSGRQWRQRTTRLWPTCDYSGGGTQKGQVRTRCKQYTQPQTTIRWWSVTSHEEAWGLAVRGPMRSVLCQRSREDRYRMNLVRMLETSSASFCSFSHTALADNTLPNRSNSCHKVDVLWSVCLFLEDHLFLKICWRQSNETDIQTDRKGCVTSRNNKIWSLRNF